jgi:hypothetical protein
MMHRRFGARWAAALVALLALSGVAPSAHAVPGPWQRTETRQPCASFDIFRQPYFGDTHVHTAYSSDAVFAGTREDPRGAYRFAQGAAIGLAPYDAQDMPTRTAQLRRPLDFTAVTDHAEQFGEIQICLTPGLPGYDSSDCVAARTQLATPPPALPSLLPPPAVIAFLFGYGVFYPPQRFSWCGPGGADCLAEASLVWQDIQAAAEEFYDRTAACTFTTFVGYEWSGQPGGNNLHRNIIFRNATVPALPTSYMEQPTPQGLWATLQSQCLDGLPGCDVLAIPHNPNASGGLMFAPVNADNSPLTAADATFRSSMEPLVEMNQHKGDSECRPGVQSTDEICGFEKLNRLQLFSPISDPNQTFPPLNYVRNALKEGLVQEQQIGVNPFKLGLIGSTDTHNSTPGATEEQDFGNYGHLGLRDHANPAYMLARVTPAGIEATPGGLAVVWAEENSRDALFAAMRRREVYGTSGTRPILRFFGGRELNLRCGDPNFVATAYDGGVPMGGDIGPVLGTDSPRFGVLAFRDPGTPTTPGTPLQRVQIVKGWVDASGQSHEKVFDVAGDPNDGASVDTTTCTPSGTGFDSLCAVWKDPEFNAAERAFYYARVLENPTCRWSTYLCNAQGIDCSNPAAVPSGYAECCNPIVAKTIQERAWSSPIWYRPEGVARVRGTMRFRGQPQGVLGLRMELGAMPAGFDPSTQALTIALRDDDEVYRATIPAGTLRQVRPSLFVWNDASGSIGGIRSLSLGQRGRKVVLRLRTIPINLAAADHVDHFIEVSLSAGSTAVVATPLWHTYGQSLVATH